MPLLTPSPFHIWRINLIWTNLKLLLQRISSGKICSFSLRSYAEEYKKNVKILQTDGWKSKISNKNRCKEESLQFSLNFNHWFECSKSDDRWTQLLNAKYIVLLHCYISIQLHNVYSYNVYICDQMFVEIRIVLFFNITDYSWIMVLSLTSSILFHCA